MNANSFVNELRKLSFENTFNPYAERCNIWDLADAPMRRRAMLKNMIRAASNSELDSIWIGRDLGYRGGRRTGLALTDDIHLHHHTQRWGIEPGRITKGQGVSERTATVIWEVLASIDSPVFLWNVFPLHPFEKDDQFTNRAHSAKERRAGEQILDKLVELLKPRRLIAIGNDAEKATIQFKDRCEIMKVRHPSFGGQNIFIDQVKKIYGIAELKNDEHDLFK